MAATSRKARAPVIALASLVLASFALAGAGSVSNAAPPEPASKAGHVHIGGKVPSSPLLNKSAPVSVDASSFELDYGTHHLIFNKPVIAQNDLRITAERADATGLDFQNSRWIFTGDVHLSSEYRGKLDSDEAVVEFRDNQMQTAVATGHPAQFEQTDSTTGVLARGHADNIQYEVAAATIHLNTDAWLKYGDNNEVTAPELTYDIKTQRFLGSGSRAGQRVHLTIVPKKGVSQGPEGGPRPPAKPAPKAKSESQASSAGSGRSSSAQGALP